MASNQDKWLLEMLNKLPEGKTYTIEDINKEIEEKFNFFDTDKSGSLDAKQVEAYMTSIFEKGKELGMPTPPEDARAAIAQSVLEQEDTNHNGVLELKEFGSLAKGIWAGVLLHQLK
eukprot:gnl/MRDRNA2_/MRDRNA2_102650_c0_seq1.p1 gnl/MRDRNA2_/MRDRNA2_102650_c0~~gnl/MRDRNA2_/MRDRNA2_102650_c0_seq1.p1  ORF type:complete len:132 (-),score=26.75 gnl/MRDRNA2_/MRDRNA2_102650_c0_seq1:600-950(-)